MSKLKKTLNEFKNLQKSIIDSSSLIYMKKTGILNQILTSLSLYTIPEVIKEINFRPDNLNIIKHSYKNIETDDILIKCSIYSKLPIISEDKVILSKIKNAGISYFNCLIMLNFLLYKNEINISGYKESIKKLKKIARYNNFIWKYGDELKESILN